jgi:hypothetical protein
VINDFTTMNITATGQNYDWALSGDTFTYSTTAGGSCGGDCWVLSGTAKYAQFTVTGTLLTIAMSAVPTITTHNGVGASQSIAVLIQNATSITENTTLLSDLNWTPTTSTVVAGSALSSATGSGSPWTAGGSSAFSVDMAGSFSASPEPVTFMLFGTGLIAVALMARRRAAVAVSK